MYDAINNLYHLIVSGNVETWNRKQETCWINPTTILFPLDCEIWQIVKTWSMGTHQHYLIKKKNHRSFFQSVVKQYQNNVLSAQLTYLFLVVFIWSFSKLTLPVTIPDEEKKLSYNFIFKLLCEASKGFMKALKTLIKPFEAPQRSVKIKLNLT